MTWAQRALRCAALCAVCVAPTTASAQPFGPAPRDADGRFANPSGPVSHGNLADAAGFLVRRLGGALFSRSGAADRMENDGAFLRENARHSVPTVTWVGHATLLVQMDHVTFLTDPIWSERASPVSWAGPSRWVKAGVAIEDLPPIDFVVISHNHYDHLDVETLTALASRNPETLFLVPLENAELLREHGVENVRELDWGQSIEIGEVEVHCLPSKHWSRRGVSDENKSLWAAWAVVGPERRFYFAGDTGYFDGFAATGAVYGPFDLAAVPIGAYEPAAIMHDSHMNPEEAVDAGLDLRAERLVGMHFGTFRLTNEPMDEPPVRFRAAAQAAGLAKENVWVLRIGETRSF